MELKGFPRAWIARKTRRGHVVLLWPSPDVTASSAPPSSHPKCSLLCTSCSAPAFQVHLTIGCTLFKSHFPSILHTLLSPSAERQKSTPLVCAIISECAIVTQFEWTCSNSMAFNLDISRIYGMQELAFNWDTQVLVTKTNCKYTNGCGCGLLECFQGLWVC